MSANMSGLFSSSYHYTKKFAFLRKECSDGSKVWLKPYYVVHRVRGLGKPFHSYAGLMQYRRTFIEYISEPEYLMRKLIGTL